MAKLSDKAREAYRKQRPERRIIDAREPVAPQPAAAPDGRTPDLTRSHEADSAATPGDRMARLREKFLGQKTGHTSSAAVSDAISDGPARPRLGRSTSVVTDADGQIKVDLVDPDTGDIEVEQG